MKLFVNQQVQVRSQKGVISTGVISKIGAGFVVVSVNGICGGLTFTFKDGNYTAAGYTLQ